MRQAVIVIRWEGPDKKVRELIGDAVDDLFQRDEFMEAVSFADSDVTFTPRLKSS